MHNHDCLLNGTWQKISETRISPLTHTLHYATGVFEGVRSYGGKIFALESHTRRLLRSANLIGLRTPYSERALNAWQKEIILRNCLSDAYIRPLIFLGEGPMNLDIERHPVQLLISAWEMPAVHAHKQQVGIYLKTVSVRKPALNSTKIKAKAVSHYLNSALALHEAREHGADEALLLDQQGYVCEGSGQNLFFVKDGQLFTPTLETALDGITRSIVIDLAKAREIRVTEGNYTPRQLLDADEIFLTGTASEVIGVRQLDDKIMEQNQYSMTTMLQEAYHDHVRQ